MVQFVLFVLKKTMKIRRTGVRRSYMERRNFIYSWRIVLLLPKNIVSLQYEFEENTAITGSCSLRHGERQRTGLLPP